MTAVRKAPVAVFGFNRPKHLRLTLDALSRCDGFAGRPVTIFLDAPRSETDVANVAATRAVVRTWTQQYPARIVERPQNMGYHNIVDGVTRMCDEHGRTIVLEDDIVVAPDSLRYMDEALTRYADEPRVYHVSVQMYADVADREPQLFFLPTALVWGWGTWKRAWDRFDWDATGWQEMLADPVARRRFDLGGGVRFSHDLWKTMTGRLTTWDIRWTYTVFMNGGVGLYPARSLSWNTGVGGGVHGLGSGQSLDHRIDFIHGREDRKAFTQARLRWPLNFPDRIEVDERVFEIISARLRAYRRLDRRLRRAANRGIQLVWSRWSERANDAKASETT